MSPCSDERPGQRKFEQHMREGAALLCSIIRRELNIYDRSVEAWWEQHQKFDALYDDHGDWEEKK